MKVSMLNDSSGEEILAKHTGGARVSSVRATSFMSSTIINEAYFPMYCEVKA